MNLSLHSRMFSGMIQSTKRKNGRNAVDTGIDGKEALLDD